MPVEPTDTPRFPILSAADLVQAAVDRTVADNPERPRGFVQAVLASLSEPRTTATPFVPRSRPK